MPAFRGSRVARASEFPRRSSASPESPPLVNRRKAAARPDFPDARAGNNPSSDFARWKTATAQIRGSNQKASRFPPLAVTSAEINLPPSPARAPAAPETGTAGADTVPAAIPSPADLRDASRSEERRVGKEG